VDDYIDTYSKLALGLTSAQVAKESLVAEFGVGEDVPFNFIGWSDHRLALIVQMKRDRMKDSIEQRFSISSGALHMMGAYFGCEELTMVAEGYHNRTPEIPRSATMAESFATGDKDVAECLTVTHVSLIDGYEPEATLISAPYQYMANKFIVWADKIAYTKGVGKILRDSPFPAMMALSLREEFQDPDDDERYRLLEVLDENGFNVQIFE
jgi:hypothetical protein